MSHPSWVCGLKPRGREHSEDSCGVTPFVGVWIETVKAGESYKLVGVTPFVGVWIETTKHRSNLYQ